ncbi:F1F0 ATPase subunit 2 [Trichococcus patagoniensis]|uniref:F1F0 ATPase subunit 2 n=1 Tax=Trichococcus patagoniensis TaxID=382641 RepID=A0A2T5IPR9_9LACT|nr:ATP synthase subunit I [Trichococcus patagoniensis]PTQ85809.1 F1F0 ATPase subunit 2 [Trichococcus patagoniensis]
MAIALFGGVFLGVLFFGGLLLTVRLLVRVRYPTVLMLGSLLLRLGILLGGLYLLKDGSYLNLPLALLGILIGRFLIVSKVKQQQGPDEMRQEG